MSDLPQFNTPPIPPKAPSFGVPQAPVKKQEEPLQAQEQPKKQGVELPSDNFASALKLPTTIFKTKNMASILAGTACIGMLLGALFFGGGSPPPSSSQPQGLQGVVPNPDIRENLFRCGTVMETAPCIVYLVNHTRNDRYAETFFDEAARLTGRSSHRIMIDNQRYAKTRIGPGYITQIKIPAR